MVELRAIWLRSGGDEGGAQYVEVCIEHRGAWVSLIRTPVADAGGAISTIIEPSGIDARLAAADDLIQEIK